MHFFLHIAILRCGPASPWSSLPRTRPTLQPSSSLINLRQVSSYQSSFLRSTIIITIISISIISSPSSSFSSQDVYNQAWRGSTTHGYETRWRTSRTRRSRAPPSTCTSADRLRSPPCWWGTSGGWRISIFMTTPPQGGALQHVPHNGRHPLQ